MNHPSQIIKLIHYVCITLKQRHQREITKKEKKKKEEKKKYDIIL
jgi:hypothetical protein